MARVKKSALEGLNGALVATVRAEMAALRMTQPQLAKKASVSNNTLTNYLSPDPGRARVMPIDIVGLVAEALGMTAAQLLGKAEERLSEQRNIQAKHTDSPSPMEAPRVRVWATTGSGKTGNFLQAYLAGDDDALPAGLPAEVREHITRARAELDAAAAQGELRSSS